MSCQGRSPTAESAPLIRAMRELRPQCTRPFPSGCPVQRGARFAAWLPHAIRAFGWAAALVFPCVGLCQDDEPDELDLPAVATATAKAPQPPAPSASPARQRWYGWQLMLADAASVGLYTWSTAGNPLENPSTVGLIGAQLYLFGPPVIHAVMHDKPKTGLASLGLRLGLPLLGAGMSSLIGHGIGLRRCPREQGLCQAVAVGSAAYIGLGVGYLTAIGLDAAWLAWEDEPVPARAVRWAPVVTPAAGGGWAGVQARF